MDYGDELKYLEDNLFNILSDIKIKERNNDLGSGAKLLSSHGVDVKIGNKLETFWSLYFFFLENDGCGLSGAMGDRGQQMGAAALPLALNHVESKWACAISARVHTHTHTHTRHVYWRGRIPPRGIG